jgi:putative ABC transport system permease protein
MAARPHMDRPKLVDGRWVGAGAGEIVLEHSFARNRHFQVGDRVEVLRGKHPIDLTVVGIAVTAATGVYPDWDPAMSWVSPATLRSFAPNRQRLGQDLHIALADQQAATAFVDRVQASFPPDRVAAWSWKEVEDSATQSTSGLTVVLGSASLFALLAAGFVIANAISGRVLASRRDIGLLKAAGFTPGGVTWLFVTENLILALVAGVVGTAAGIAVSPLLLHKSAELLGTPTPSGFSVAAIAAGVLGVAAVVALFTALPAWRAGRLKVLEAIRLGRSSVSARPSRAAAFGARLGLPPAVTLGFKDAFSARSRAVMTILSLSLTMFAVVAALGTEATYHRVIGDSSLRAKPYDLLIGTGIYERNAATLIQHHSGEIQGMSRITSLPVSVPGRGLEMQARVLGGDYRKRPYAIRAGRMLAGPGETIVGRGTLDKLGLHIGDHLRVNALGVPLDLLIVGRYIEPDNDAVTALFDERSLPPAARAKLRPDYALTVAPVSAARKLGSELEAESKGALQATVTEDDVKQERDDLRPIIWGMDILLLAIGLVNLLTTLLLAVRERRRDYAIFTTLGLTPRQLLATVTASGSLLAVVAIVIGVPLGAVIFHQLVVATNPTDGPDLVTNPTWWWLVLLLPATLAFTTIASLLPARQAAEIKPAEALRYE